MSTEGTEREAEKGESEIPAGADEEQLWGGTARRPRILLAEDDHDVRVALAHLLELAGYDVSPVANGAEMLDVLAASILLEADASPPDIIITDVRMPGFNGLSIVEGLRANGWTQPVIVISAFGDENMKERISRMDHTAFFAKPFDPEKLERALLQLMH
jgi:CheY-like chemotaxis protein